MDGGHCVLHRHEKASEGSIPKDRQMAPKKKWAQQWKGCKPLWKDLRLYSVVEAVKATLSEESKDIIPARRLAPIAPPKERREAPPL